MPGKGSAETEHGDLKSSQMKGPLKNTLITLRWRRCRTRNAALIMDQRAIVVISSFVIWISSFHLALSGLAQEKSAITFNKNFEGGALGKIEKLGDAQFRCHVEGQHDEHGRNRQANSRPAFEESRFEKSLTPRAHKEKPKMRIACLVSAILSLVVGTAAIGADAPPGRDRRA